MARNVTGALMGDPGFGPSPAARANEPGATPITVVRSPAVREALQESTAAARASRAAAVKLVRAEAAEETSGDPVDNNADNLSSFSDEAPKGVVSNDTPAELRPVAPIKAQNLRFAPGTPAPATPHEAQLSAEVERLRAELAAALALQADLIGTVDSIRLAGLFGLEPRQAQLLALLWQRAPYPVAYRTIIDAAYSTDPDGGIDQGTLKSRITKTRNKLAQAGAPSGLNVVRGQGAHLTAEMADWLGEQLDGVAGDCPRFRKRRELMAERCERREP